MSADPASQGVAAIDHLVVAAATLADGVAWCEATLGLVPEPGGAHPLMGTHNRLLRIGAHAYLEIIAIDPAATPTRTAGHHRWYDLDDPMLRETVARRGPHLVHVVAGVPRMGPALAALTALGLDRGPALAASRMTPSGLLEWRITVRDDGQRLFWGALPTLIEWGAVHPSASLPARGVQLLSLEAHHPRPEPLANAWRAIGWTPHRRDAASVDLEIADAPPTVDAGAPVDTAAQRAPRIRLALTAGTPNLVAQLQTPRGLVTLASEGT